MNQLIQISQPFQYDKSNQEFLELEKFPRCAEPNCCLHLELQNRFKCIKCTQIFCCDHRLGWKHKCPSLIVETNIKPTKYIEPVLPKCQESRCRCKLTQINNFLCSGCGKKYCMAHRLNFVHKCIKS